MVAVGRSRSVLRSGEPSGVPQEVMRPTVVVVDTEASDFVYPFGETAVSWAPQWSPDGHRLVAYIQKDDNPACLAIWDRNTSTTEVYENAKYVGDYGFEVPRWTSDGRRILMKADPGKQDAGARRIPERMAFNGGLLPNRLSSPSMTGRKGGTSSPWTWVRGRFQCWPRTGRFDAGARLPTGLTLPVCASRDTTKYPVETSAN